MTDASPQTADAALAVHDLERVYRSGDRELRVLSGLELSVARGERVSIIGRSGSGKSTLLGLLAGLDHPDGGQVVIGGQDLAALPASDLARFRGQRIGVVFQSYRLLPTLTAEENVAVPLELTGVPNARARAREWLDRVGLGDRGHHRPSRLSGGEQQRVGVARALAPEPDLVLADEPTGNLDAETAAAIADLLFELAAGSTSALVCVTHDRELAQRGDRVLDLHGGQLHAIDLAAAP